MFRKRKSVDVISPDAKKQRLSRAAAADSKSNPTTMTIMLPAYLEYEPVPIIVKRPVVHTEELVVKFDLHMIQHIIAFIRHKGFVMTAKKRFGSRHSR